MMHKILMRFTLVLGFGIGVLLAVLIFRIQNKKHLIPAQVTNNYEKWFDRNHLKRTILTPDYAIYGDFNKNELESNFLYNRIRISCVLLVRKHRNAVAANATWGQRCNFVTFVYLQTEQKEVRSRKNIFPIRQSRLESSWRLLCDSFRDFKPNFDWFLFVPDDTFALPENLRYMVAHLNPNEPHYLGHAVTRWGVNYNLAQAGYVLSKRSLTLLKNRFRNRDDCEAGGRFWRQEDYYLGKHLSSLGVRPVDTRDSNGFTRFHSHNLAQILSKGSSLSLSVHYSASVFPVTKCCSPYTVTFQTIEADKMYTNYYLLYQLQVFYEGGHLGNARPHHHHHQEDQVWKSFVREQGGNETFANNISAYEYYELWKKLVSDPVNFNRNIQKWSASVTQTTESTLLLSEIRNKNSKHNYYL